MRVVQCNLNDVTMVTFRKPFKFFHRPTNNRNKKYLMLHFYNFEMMLIIEKNGKSVVEMWMYLVDTYVWHVNDL